MTEGRRPPRPQKESVMETSRNGIDRSAEGKEKAIGVAIAQIERQFGKGAIMRLGAQPSALDVAVISTGAISLDAALGVGGIPRGRVTEIFGPEASGKTTLALHLIAEVQKTGGIAAFIDAEHALDPVYAQKLGVKTDELLMSQALRKLAGIISKSKTSMIFINQLRQKIGMFVGNPETTTGGNALKFYASVRLDVRRIGQIKEGETTSGSRVRVKVVKNKVAPPFRQAEFDMMYGEGISREGDLLDLASEKGLISKSGAWYAYQEERIGQGRENAKKYLKEHADLTAALAQQLRQMLGLTPGAAESLAITEQHGELWEQDGEDA